MAIFFAASTMAQGGEGEAIAVEDENTAQEEAAQEEENQEQADLALMDSIESANAKTPEKNY